MLVVAGLVDRQLCGAAPQFASRGFHADVVGMVERLVLRGAFRNSWLEIRVLGR